MNSYQDEWAVTPPRRRASALLVIGVLALAMTACVAPLHQQQSLAALHTSAKRQCLASPAKCADLSLCTHALQDSLAAYQRLNQAIASGGDESVPTADALVTEATARAVCAARGVK